MPVLLYREPNALGSPLFLVLAFLGQGLDEVEVGDGVVWQQPTAVAYDLEITGGQVGDAVQVRRQSFRQPFLRQRREIPTPELASAFGVQVIGEPHVRFDHIGAGMDDFGRRLSGNRPVHFVLHGLEELNADLHCWVVIDTGGIDVRDFLIKPALGGADILTSRLPAWRTDKYFLTVASGTNSPSS